MSSSTDPITGDQKFNDDTPNPMPQVRRDADGNQLEDSQLGPGGMEYPIRPPQGTVDYQQSNRDYEAGLPKSTGTDWINRKGNRANNKANKSQQRSDFKQQRWDSNPKNPMANKPVAATKPNRRGNKFNTKLSANIDTPAAMIWKAHQISQQLATKQAADVGDWVNPFNWGWSGENNAAKSNRLDKKLKDSKRRSKDIKNKRLQSEPWHGKNKSGVEGTWPTPPQPWSKLTKKKSELDQLTGHTTKQSRYNSRHILQAGGPPARPQPLTRRQSREQFLNYLGHLMDKAQQGRPPGKADFGNNPPNRFKLSPADRNWAEEAGSKPFPKLDFEPYKPMTPESPMPK